MGDDLEDFDDFDDADGDANPKHRGGGGGGGNPADTRPNDNVGADMCVRSLAWETTSESLRSYFEAFGQAGP